MIFLTYTPHFPPLTHASHKDRKKNDLYRPRWLINQSLSLSLSLTLVSPSPACHVTPRR